MRILGIDPGSIITGYGVITSESNQLHLVTAGALRLSRLHALSDRLREAADGIGEVLRGQQPDEVCIEDIFQHASVRSAFVLAHVRGAIMLELARSNLPIYEYTALQVKKALTGHGHADKKQVRFMVQRLLGMKSLPEPMDVSDALGVAICHAHTGAVRRRWRGR